MPKKKLIQIISVVFLLVGALLSIPGTNWKDAHSTLAFSSIVFGTLGSLISIFIPSNYTRTFTTEQWVDGEGPYKDLLIKASKHGQGVSPTAQVFTIRDGVCKECLCDVSHDSNGDVTVSIYGPPTTDFKVIIS